MTAAKIDQRRRLVMPRGCPANSTVTIQQIDSNTWLIKRALPDKHLKVVAIPVLDELPDDPEWDKVETAFGHAAARKARPE